METWLIVLLVIGALMLIGGIFRVTRKPFVSIGDTLLELLWLDIIFDIFSEIDLDI
jgi:hypothetical protein